MKKKAGEIEVMKIAGIPVLVHLSVIVMPILIFCLEKPHSFVEGLLVFVGLILLILVHELGHAWVARRFGLKVYSLRIGGFHGLCTYEKSRSWAQRVAVSWGGVLAQLLLAALFILAAQLLSFAGAEVPRFLHGLFFVFIPASFGIIIFNLLPIPPLDGATAWQVFPLMLVEIPKCLERKEKPSSDGKLAGKKMSIEEWRSSRQAPQEKTGQDEVK